jgi:hypothetical protein
LKLLIHAKKDPKLISQSVTQLILNSPGTLVKKVEEQVRVQRGLPPARRNKKISGSLIKSTVRSQSQMVRQLTTPSLRLVPF